MTDVEQRARHLALSSTEPDAAIAADLEAAARHASTRGTPDTAAELMVIASQRTPPGDRADAARRMAAAGVAFIEAGDPNRARSVLEAYVSGTDAGPHRAQVLFVLADTRSTDSWEAELALLEQALAEAGEDHRLRAQILEARVGARWVACRDAKAAIRDGLDAIAEAEQQDDTIVRSTAYMQTAFAQYEAGEQRNDAFVERAVALRPAGEGRLARGPSFQQAVWAERLEESAGILEELRAAALASGDVDSLTLIEWDLGMTLMRLGRWGEARNVEREAERRSRQTGQLTGLAGILVNRAYLDAAMGDLDGAAAAVDEGEAVADSIGARMFVAIGQDARGFAALARGDLQAADRAIRPRAPCASTRGTPAQRRPRCAPTGARCSWPWPAGRGPVRP